MLRVGTEVVAGLHGEGEGGGGEAALLQKPPSVVKPLLAKPGQCSYFANVQNYALVVQRFFGHFGEINVQKAAFFLYLNGDVINSY